MTAPAAAHSQIVSVELGSAGSNMNFTSWIIRTYFATRFAPYYSGLLHWSFPSGKFQVSEPPRPTANHLWKPKHRCNCGNVSGPAAARLQDDQDRSTEERPIQRLGAALRTLWRVSSENSGPPLGPVAKPSTRTR